MGIYHGNVSDQLKGVEEYPGRQELAAKTDQEEHGCKTCDQYSVDHILDRVDLTSILSAKLAHDFPLELSSEFDLDSVEALEELDSVECHCNEVFRRESVQILWVVKVDL